MRVGFVGCPVLERLAEREFDVDRLTAEHAKFAVEDFVGFSEE